MLCEYKGPSKIYIVPRWRVATSILVSLADWHSLSYLGSATQGGKITEKILEQTKGAQERKLGNQLKLLIVVKIVISSQPFEISAIFIFSQDRLGNKDSLTLIAMIWQDYWKESQEIFEYAKLNVDQNQNISLCGLAKKAQVSSQFWPCWPCSSCSQS